MKKTLLSIMILCTFTGIANAANSVDLKVTGKLTNNACTPTIENGGVFDMGHIPVKNMSAVDAKGYEVKSYQHKKINIDITCSSAMSVGFTMTDNQAGTVPQAFSSFSAAYGLGKTVDDKYIGLYQLYYNAATIDGQVGKLLYSENNGQAWGNAFALNYVGFIYAFSTPEGTTPVSGKDFHLKMDTAYYFDKTIVDELQDDLAFEGSTTFNLIYL